MAEPGDRRSFMKKATGLLGLAAAPELALAAREAQTAPPPGLHDVTFSVNGKKRTLRIDPRVTLLDALRERMDLTGAKKGCDHGACGACTVLVNGRRVNACLTLAVTCRGKDVLTIEGLAQGDTLHPVQQAFLEDDAFQCGFCTPGQILSAVACIREDRAGSDLEIREAMSGNLCRCGAYPNIVAAVKRARDAQAGRAQEGRK